MDLMLLRIYQRQVAYYCKAVLLGVADINSGVQAAFSHGQQGDEDRLWYGVQNLIVATGNLSKTLWGAGDQKARQRRYVERQPLRDSLSVTDSSPLRKVKIRNDYEHLDERIEEWWETSPNRNFISELVGPRGSVGGDAIHEKDTLRWIDPTTGDVVFWGNELNISRVVDEVQRILPIAEGESSKPH